MMMKNKLAIEFIAIFAVAVLFLGLLSFYKLVDFYVNDEVDYNEWEVSLGSKEETDIASTFFHKIQFVNFNGAVRNLLNQHEMNGVVKLNNGYLVSPYAFVENNTLEEWAENTADLQEYLDKRGTSLVYIATPETSSKYDPELPTGIEDWGNDNTDRFLECLNKAGVDTIDLREEMREDEIDHYEMMYKTDHHWNTRAGFYAFQKMEEYIVGVTGCEVDNRVSDIENYDITVYPEWHLGSNGQRTGRFYAGSDDFELFVPKFESNIQAESGKNGTMQEMVYDLSPLSDKDYTSRYTYDKVLGNSIGHYINLDSENDVKVLVISDSYAKAVFPYLMMDFAEVTYQYDMDVSKITKEYIEDFDPDVVVMLYYTGHISPGSKSFDFKNFK